MPQDAAGRDQGSGGSGSIEAGVGGDAAKSPDVNPTQSDASATDTTPTDDASLPPQGDASTDANNARDALADRADDAPILRDACVLSNGGGGVCDGIDNNCNGGIDEGQTCPAGCSGARRNDTGYMLCSGQGVRKSWQNAQTDCTSRGMHLVRIDDAVQNQWIPDLLLTVGSPTRVWIGASEPTQVGFWVWTDATHFWQGQANGMAVGGRYANWEPGQPDRATPGEDCATIRATAGWGDDTCSNTNPYLCQR